MTTGPLNINEAFRKSLDEDKASALVKLNNWPMGKVAEKLISTGCSKTETVDEHILSYKQFMFFHCLYPKTRCGMYSESADEVWHQHILFTQDYEHFCHEIFGRFIHHTPCNVMDPSSAALDEYSTWAMKFKNVFKGVPILPRIPPYCQG